MTPLSSAPALPALGVLAAIVGGCASNQPAPPPRGAAVSGTIAYRERVALPPDAEVEVQLSDVSRMDAPAETIAETTVPPDGRQVPLPFELRYDPGKIEPRNTYAVRASIRSGGRLLFTTTSAYRVITGGNPTHVDLLLTQVQAPAESTATGLWGTTWVLEDLAGAGVMDYVRATLEFPESGKVAGNGSCNRFSGSATITGNALSISPLGTTQRACPEAVGDQESRYLKALQAATRFEIDGPWLLVYSAGLDQPLKFTAAE